MKSPLTKRIVFWTACWVVFVFTLGFLVQQFLPFVPTYPYYDYLLGPMAPGWLARWGGFDGVHYITIAMQGYFGIGLIQAFFPVYPLLMRFLNVLQNPLITGLLISILSFFASMIMLVKLALLEKTQETQSKKYLVGLMLAVLTFPTAFFFLGVYTESLFLLLVLLTFYFAYKKQWLYAAIFAGIASGTRIVGIALFPALLFQVLITYRQTTKQLPWKAIGIVCLSCIGLVAYMTYLNYRFNDPIYFLHVQSEFGGGRQDNFITFPQVVYRYIKIMMTYRPIDWSYFSYLQELVITIEVGIALFVATKLKQLRNIPFLFYSWFTYLLPSLTGTFGSMPRYVLVIFPLYFLYAKLYVRKPRLASALFAVHGILLIINIVLFIQGKWVA